MNFIQLCFGLWKEEKVMWIAEEYGREDERCEINV